MARARNHKAEYAARKAKAQALGYSGVSQYRGTRKALNLPRTRRTPSRAVAVRYSPVLGLPRSWVGSMRREARKWSEAHSHSPRSAYRPDMSDAEVRAYHRAYVQRVEGTSRRKAAREKRLRILNYVIEWHDVEPDEWAQQYGITSE